MRLSVLLLIGFSLLGCKKKDSPNPPERAFLTFPDKNSECTTGKIVDPATSSVQFRWQAADHTNTYELRVTNINSGTTQTISSKSTSAVLPLERGVPFSWFVVSKNSGTKQTASSETWRFFNAGAQTTSHAPFPAEIIAPNLSANAFKDINNELLLDWSGADIDDDIDGYEIYFSTETPPATSIASPNAGTTELKVDVSSNTVYYWKVITKDRAGNTSDSGIYDFKVL